MKKVIQKKVFETVDTIDNSVRQATKQLDVLIEPTRSTFAKRYPTLFSLLATLGVVMTFLGVEQLLLASSLLVRYPVLILACGVGLLAVTGTLYKKLTNV